MKLACLAQAGFTTISSANAIDINFSLPGCFKDVKAPRRKSDASHAVR
jgi:hypothetical protein